ncbi:MAG: molybdopterin-dependent oxidoreductase [Candidatus Cloacimonetes bacterium]|nr:molybdopterin-dependent oxidoreductase [Candidatus Cloacimonadota bacterium]
MKKQPFHISGKLHLTGTSRFIADEAPLAGMLHAKFFYAPVAHAKVLELDISKAAAIPGVERVVTAADIPGDNQIGHVIKDEPLFPEQEIMYLGQPLAMVLASDELLAEDAAKLIRLEYEELPPLLEIDAADAKGEWYIPERKIEIGEVAKALAEAAFTLQGVTESAAQEHFYMESQRCRAVPGEGRTLTLYTATQSTMEVQEVMSHVLEIPSHHIIVDVPRLGGAFGGKERSATLWACLAGLGAFLTQKPVQVLLTREEDMRSTGKRHPFKSSWKVGFDASGRISALDIELLSNGGAYADLSIAILERALFHADNAYHIANARIRGRACRTNLPPNTAFRGFGAPQGVFVIEAIMERIARKLGLDPLELRQNNVYRSGDLTPYGQPVRESNLRELLDKLRRNSSYDKLKEEVQAFNSDHEFARQGLGIVPVKFGISFTTALLNQASALLWVYIDGSVSLTTGGVEMGQEVSTKCALVVSRVLGLPLQRIRVESNNSQRVGNASPTAASTGSDLNGNAARIAAEKLRDQLIPVAREMLARQGVDCGAGEIRFEDNQVWCVSDPDQRVEFAALVREAYNARVPLAAYGYYRTPGLHFDRERGQGNPFHYYVCGCALAQVEIDLLSGEHRVLKTFIVHENGNSLSEEIDRGQIIGAFVQSAGWCTIEELPQDETGRYLAVNPSTYKIPTVRETPIHLEVEIVPAGAEYASVFGSKATGEPPYIYGLAIWFAIQNAVWSVNPAAELRFPATPEAVLLALE